MEQGSMRILLLIGFTFLFLACGHNDGVTPKPRGYFRIVFPKKNYVKFDEDCNYTFDYPDYAQVIPDHTPGALSCWKNIVFKPFNGSLKITYYGHFNHKEYGQLTEDARALAMKHTIKANAIDQKIINYPEHKVYGIYYAIDGNTASSTQFFLTDSLKNYIRGALYFNEKPQADSLAPVVKFIKQDIDRMIASFRWKN